mmetsp:Transcript_11212/g.30178  ORF Transcript_11212/g.30178 Transcript_11212/m.30178 type:complete len:301 (-) Transcript_11212:224-1126(-)
MAGDEDRSGALGMRRGLRSEWRRLGSAFGVEHLIGRRDKAFRGAVTRSAGDMTHIPTAATAVLKVSTLNGDLESVDDVCRLLEELRLEKYREAFRAQGVDFKVFLSLTNADLKKPMGMKCLADRRLLLDAIAYFKETAATTTKQMVPEHGRLLTHLDNARTAFAWLRLSLWMLQISLFVLHIPEELCNPRLKKPCALMALALFLVVLLYGMHRYTYVLRRMESIHDDVLPDHTLFVAPMQLILLSGFAILFGFLTTASQTKTPYNVHTSSSSVASELRTKDASSYLALLGSTVIELLATS